MTTNNTPPAKREFCVWADYVRRVFQHVEAESAGRAYEIAAKTDAWEPCDLTETDCYRLTNEVMDLATEEFIAPEGGRTCETCGSEIVHGVNDSTFGDGECGACEYARYRSCRKPPATASLTSEAREAVPPKAPWTEDLWAAAHADSRWAAERGATDMRERLRRYPALHAEDKIRLAMDILWDVCESWDHDTLLHYPAELPSFDEYLATIGSNVYAIRWSRPNPSPADADGNAA